MQSADLAQQAFSYDSTPILHAALPALEALHKSWTTKAAAIKYFPFVATLEAALTKVEDYYDKMSTSEAYTFVMRTPFTCLLNYHYLILFCFST